MQAVYSHLAEADEPQHAARRDFPGTLAASSFLKVHRGSRRRYIFISRLPSAEDGKLAADIPLSLWSMMACILVTGISTQGGKPRYVSPSGSAKPNVISVSPQKHKRRFDTRVDGAPGCGRRRWLTGDVWADLPLCVRSLYGHD